MLETMVAEVLRNRWIDLDDNHAPWCEATQQHIYCVVRPEGIAHHPISAGALFSLDSRVYKVCAVNRLHPGEDGPWLLIYAHPQEDDGVAAMTEEEWHELYGDEE